MNKTEAKKRIQELRELTEYHAKKYYDEDSPEITDYEYDMLLHELKDLETQFPEFIEKLYAVGDFLFTVKVPAVKLQHDVTFIIGGFKRLGKALEVKIAVAGGKTITVRAVVA